MNNAYRVVWSKAREAWMAVPETACARGKPAKSVMAAAVATALLQWTQLALSACGGDMTISGTVSGCDLSSGTPPVSSLWVTSTGAIDASITDAVWGSGASVSTVLNEGLIRTTATNGYSFYISSGSSIGSITNHGTIETGSSGLFGIISSDSSIGVITNTGTISGTNKGIVLIGTSVLGALNNSGSILSGDGAWFAPLAVLTGASVGTITNSGTISGGVSDTVVGIYSHSASIGSIINTSTGTIHGSLAGVGLFNNSSATGISNAGSISGGEAGIGLDGSTIGSITNSGTLTGTLGGGIYLIHNSSIGSITNDGRIVGYDPGIGIDSSTVGSLTNRGVITNTGSGMVVGGLYVTNGSLGSLTNTGTISGNGHGLAVFNGTLGNVVNSGEIRGTGNGIYLNGGTIANLTNSGAIMGGGMSPIAIMVNSGTLGSLTITGNGTAWFYGAVVAPNTPTTVATGAAYVMLGGEQFTVSSFTNAGTLHLAATPSGHAGTISGDFSNQGVLELDSWSNTNYGRLKVTGNATISGSAHVYVPSGNTLAVGQTLSGVITAGSLTGNFAAVTDDSLLFNFSSVVNGNQIDFQITRGITVTEACQALGNTPCVSNGKGAAGVLDGLITSGATGDMGAVITRLGQLSTERQVSEAATQTLPILQAGLPRVALGVQGNVGRFIQARQMGVRGLSSGDGFSDRRFWLKPLGAWADQKDRNGAIGFDSRSWGVVLGADGQLSAEDRIGVSFAYADTKADSNDGIHQADLKSYFLSLYGVRNIRENVEFDWVAGYGYHENDTRRDIRFMGRTATADFNSQGWHLGVGLQQRVDLSSKTRLIPRIALTYDQLHDDGYTESGAGALNLAVDGKTTRQTVLSLSGRLEHALDDRSLLQADLGVGHDFSAKRNSLNAAFVGGGGAFTTEGIDPAKTVWRGGVGYLTNTTSGMQLTARYDIEGRPSGYKGQTSSIKLRWVF